MKIDTNFTGGNIVITSAEADTVILKPDLRDTAGNWFYWAFRVSGAAGKTVNFIFDGRRVGYWGPAVSRDLVSWRWLGKQDDYTKYTYTFKEDEDTLYFAHNMLYHQPRFTEFIAKHGLAADTLCVSGKGRDIPCLSLGGGKIGIVLTARHHACESTGNYVLEGVLDEYIQNPIPDTKIFCVPFVDYDGVVDGDQGKNRRPHDHNRDYDLNDKAIYASVDKIRRYIETNKPDFGFDFHSPGHYGGSNDKVFLVEGDPIRTAQFSAFSKVFEKNITPSAMKYRQVDDILSGQEWNEPNWPSYTNYILKNNESSLAAGHETAYFGLEDNIFSPEAAVELGHCFCRALAEYIITKSVSI
jgi:hypothetical protein